MPLKVLLTDGSGLTARQTASRLHAAGHIVEALAPDPLCLCRFTRHVRHIHPTPSSGAEPLAWLNTALAVYRSGRFDVLLPTQEQVAVLAAVPARLADAGVRTAVPTFAALAAVQDKLSAFETLTRLGVAQPRGAIDPAEWDVFPAYVKQPIGTASAGVRKVASAPGLQRTVGRHPHVLVQAAAEGPLAMCQSVWDHGRLIAFHACLRTGEGANGGASHKRAIELPAAQAGLEVLGRGLGWHGALSADVIVTDAGPLFIDINPRLVEPENASRAGVDLVGSLVDVATRRPHQPAPPPPSGGVATHQLLLAVLGAAQDGHGRRGVATELITCWRHHGRYVGSAEELTPCRGDPLAAVPVVVAAIATLVEPSAWRRLAGGTVANYALTPPGWDQIVRAAEVVGLS